MYLVFTANNYGILGKCFNTDSSIEVTSKFSTIMVSIFLSNHNSIMIATNTRINHKIFLNNHCSSAKNLNFRIRDTPNLLINKRTIASQSEYTRV